MPAFQSQSEQRKQRLLQAGVPQEIIDKAGNDDAALQYMESKMQPAAPKAFQKPEVIPSSNLTKAPNDDVEASLKSMPGLPEAVQQEVRSNPQMLTQVKGIYLQGLNNGSIKIPEASFLEDSKGLKSVGINQENVMKEADKDFAYGEFLAKKFAQGASFDIYDPEMTAPSTPGKVLGVAANLLGGTATTAAFLTGLGELGVLAGIGTKAVKATKTVKELKALKTATQALAASEDVALAAKAAQELPQVTKALRSARLVKLGAEATKQAAEGAILGGGVGAVKETIRGGSLEDVLTQSIYDSLQFAAMGAVLTPVAEGLGTFATRRQTGKLKGATEEFLSTEGNREILKRAATTDLPKLVEMKKANPEAFAKMVAGSQDPQVVQNAVRGMEAIEKIAALKPYASPSELLANPSALNAIHKTEQAEAARAIFTSPESPFKLLYDTNPNLKTMVERGHFGEAFDMLRVETAKMVGNNKDIAEFAAMPFMNDALSLAEAKATAVTSKKSWLKKGVNAEDFQNVLIKYDLNPTPELEAQVQSGLRAPALKRYKEGAIKLGTDEINDLVNNTISRNLQILADGKIRMDDIGIIQDQDSMLKALTTFNAPLNRTLFQSYERFGGSDAWFGKVPAELKDIAQPLIKKKVYEQELGQMYRSLAQKQKAMKLAVNEGDMAQATILKDEIAQANTKIRGKLTQVRAIEQGTAGADPAQLQRAQGIVDEMYMPLRSQTMGQTAQKVDLTKGPASGVEATQTFMKRFLPYENPVFIKKGSELAEYTQGLLASNQDIGEFYKLSALNIKRKITTELGNGNPISGMIEFVEQRNRAVKQHYASLTKEVDSLGIKAGSQESKMVELLGEKKIDVTHDAFTSLPVQSQQKIITATKKLRGMYDELLDGINNVMRANQLPEVLKRDDYFHHFRQVQEELPEMISKYLSGASEEVTKSGEWIFKKGFDPAMTAFNASKIRKGIEGPGDAIAGFKIYAHGALERIYLTDALRQVDAAKWMAPKNLATFLQNFKNDYILKIPDEGRQLSPGWRKAFDQARQNQARGALLGKVSTALLQLTSVPLNLGLSYKQGMKAMMSMVTKEGKELAAQSTNLLMREIKTEGAEFAPTAYKKFFGELAGGKISAGLKASEGFLEKALQGFDRVAVKHGYLTGYYKGMESGLTHEQAVRFGDYWASTIQADMTRIGQPEFYQTTIGRALGQFQSFTTNLFAAISNDLPRYANSDGAAKAVSLILKTAAGVSINNELLRAAGIPGAFDLESFVPFLGTARFGVPGLTGAIINAGKYVGNKNAGREYEAEQNWRDLKTQAVSLTGIPASGQLYKTMSYIMGEDFKRDEPLDKARGIAFGKSSKYEQDKREEQLRQEKKSPFKKKIKAFVHKNF